MDTVNFVLTILLMIVVILSVDTYIDNKRKWGENK